MSQVFRFVFIPALFLLTVSVGVASAQTASTATAMPVPVQPGSAGGGYRGQPIVAADSHTTGAPLLNSRPGAAYTVFLDFGGFNFTGGWGGNSSQAAGNLVSFDSASPVGSFNSTEQAYIKTIFARTAEKYVGMNVNVTTVDPAVAAGQATSDFARQAYYDSQARMMHTVVTSTKAADNSFVAGGGVSYIGVTQNSYSSAGINGGAGRGYHTDWIFTDQLANQGSGTVGPGTLKYISEASGHENGHGLKLIHQSAYNGTTKTAEYSTNGGSSLVAPIMGDSYDSARGTWRNGPSTTNSSTMQNDVKLLMTNSGMTSFINDGISHSMLSATPLSLGPTGTVSAAANHGWIMPASAANPNPIGEANYTTDYYSFATPGGAFNVTIDEGGELLTPGALDGGGMLDSTFRLLDAMGNTISSVNNPNSQISTINFANLSAGAYYLEVASAGGKSSSGTEAASYFDMGSYFLSGSIAVPEPGTCLVLTFIAMGAFRRARRSQV